MKLIGFDTETLRIGPGNVAPPIVCLTVFSEEQGNIWSRGDGTVHLQQAIRLLFMDEMFDGAIRIAHNAAYDLTVVVRECPTFLPGIFALIERGFIRDTRIREKLLNLTVTGNLEFVMSEHGAYTEIGYKLADLVMKYFGVNIAEDKKADDAWRLNYQVLEDIPTKDWPAEAITYAIDDSQWALKVYQAQEEVREIVIKELGVDPFLTEPFRVFADLCLCLMTCRGVALDAEAVNRIEAEVASKLTPDKLDLLISTGILRPAVPPRPHARGAKNKDGTPKMTKGVDESVNKVLLQEHVKKLAASNPLIQLKFTPPSDKFPEGQVSVDGDFLEQYWSLCPVLTQYKHRRDLQKLVTTEIPRMKWEGHPAPVVHPVFDVMKSTGRTSSYADQLFPSFNGQNVDPLVRPCYIARPGHVLFSCDYSQMELGTAAQKCIDLFGASVLADKINAGIDVHAYLGSQLARKLDEDFSDVCSGANINDPDEIFAAFLSLKDTEEFRPLYNKYRKFAKPTGLGYPGGLGAETFVTYARATYGVEVDLDTAKLLKEVWLDTYPEFREYFKWINKDIIDKVNSSPMDGNKYAYTSPMGLYRAGCDYCAAANGAALQTPSAEGAIMALCNVVRGCYDASQNSVLYGTTHPLIFIHDEIFGEMLDDDGVHERLAEIDRIMVASMRMITPDVAAKTEGVLMYRWDKKAVPVYDAAGKLIPWKPEQASK